MRDAGSPRFRDTAVPLFCFVISVAMILFLVPWLLGGSELAWISVIVFCLVIGYSALRLAWGLFTGRFLKQSGSTLVRKIIEIDGEVR